MQDIRWIIIDTETDGLQAPIHVVELAGQLMHGWEPVGTPFRMLLDHNVPISSRVVAVHGYTREYLRAYGYPPRQVYDAFRDFAADLPIVSHNLSFDWDRCLAPEWRRLDIPPVGRRGFCCLMMARRLALETGSHRLDDLKADFGLTASRSHRALADVMTIVELFQKVYRPRLVSANLDTFDAVADFARRTPVALCVGLIRQAWSRQSAFAEGARADSFSRFESASVAG